MIKKSKIVLLALMCCSGFVFSQVGINTTSPQTTFDIQAKKPTGTDGSPEGLLVPRIDRQRAQSMTNIPVSTLIHINDFSTGSQSGTAVNIDTEGYYFFDGVAWVKMITANNIQNVYKNDGSLSGNRIVTQNDKKLAFRGTATNAFSVDNLTLSVDAQNHRVGLGTDAPTAALDLKGAARLRDINTNEGANKDRVLVSDNAGYIKTVYDVPRRAVYHTSSIAPGASEIITVTESNFLFSQINVTSTNQCTRTMISSFSRNGNTLNFLGAQARSAIGNWTLLDAEGNYGSIKFPNVLGCGDGGNGTQFDYDIKITSNIVTITNRGNVNKSYSIRILTNL